MLQRIVKYIFHKPFNSLQNQLTHCKGVIKEIKEVRGRLPHPMCTMPGQSHRQDRHVPLPGSKNTSP